MQIWRDFDVTKLHWIHSNVISMVPFTHAAFFYTTKLHNKKGFRAKKSLGKKCSKFTLCVSRHLVLVNFSNGRNAEFNRSGGFHTKTSSKGENPENDGEAKMFMV